MAIVCASCDHEPDPGVTAGAACTICGDRLISVDLTDPLLGRTVDGRFEILAPLGKGGMGVVYRAKQLSIGREVALKVLDRRFEKDVAAVKRFFREAKTASNLAHPNTVPVVDFGQSEEGRLYLVMELVRGHTLHEDVVRYGPMSPLRAAGIGIQICEALEVAHAMSIVHRDLKLDNVMLLDLGGRDHIKILDFGLARTLSDPTSQMTETGLISGTPRYMPPEVALDGAQPHPSQDMYAVGVMLGEMVLGRALWHAPTLEALFHQKHSTEQTIADIPEPLKGIVRALLSEDPNARPTARETRDQLRDLQAATSPRRHERARSPVALEPTMSAGRPVASGASTEPSVQIEVNDTTVGDPFSNPQLVDLDGRDGAPPPTTPVVAPAPTQVVPPPTFAPPPRVQPKQLELDRGYVAEKASKLEARAAAEVPKPRSKAPLIASILAFVAVGAGGYYLYQYKRATPTPAPAPVPAPVQEGPRLDVGGVSLEVSSDRPADLYVDGKLAGRTPLSLKLPKSDQPVILGGPGLASQQVVPDRDRVVHLKAP